VNGYEPSTPRLRAGRALRSYDGTYKTDHIDGFGQNDCARLRADEYEQVVSWKGNADLSPVKGKNVYIRFWLKSAYLFGFRFADE